MLPSKVGKLTARYGGHRVRAEAQSGRECGRFAGSVQYSLEHLSYLTLSYLILSYLMGENVGDLLEVSNILWNTVKFAPQGSPEIGKWEARDSLSLVAHH